MKQYEIIGHLNSFIDNGTELKVNGVGLLGEAVGEIERLQDEVEQLQEEISNLRQMVLNTLNQRQRSDLRFENVKKQAQHWKRTAEEYNKQNLDEVQGLREDIEHLKKSLSYADGRIVNLVAEREHMHTAYLNIMEHLID